MQVRRAARVHARMHAAAAAARVHALLPPPPPATVHASTLLLPPHACRARACAVRGSSRGVRSLAIVAVRARSGGMCCAEGTDGGCTSCDLAGACEACGEGLYLAGGRCHVLRAPGAGCVGAHECESGACRGGVCCMRDATAACEACGSGVGACVSCTGGHFVTPFGDCAEVAGAGGACSHGGADSECASGLCRGGTCCAPTVDANCAVCDAGTGGACIACRAGYYFGGGGGDRCEVLLVAGAACASADACESASCLERCCAASTGAAGVGACSACGSDGACAACTHGHFLTIGGCVPLRVDGESCGADAECVGGRCRSGACCASTAAADANCAVCDASGACAGCGGGYFLAPDGSCAAPAPPGALCAAPGACASGACLDGRCCAHGVSSECVACSSDEGACMACSQGFHLSHERACVRDRDDGEVCGAGIECASASCKGGRCCASGTRAGCDACGAGGGCSGCAPGQHLTAAGGCENDKADGTSCASNTECTHGVCHKKCCASGVSEQCTSCGKSGACAGCSAGYVLVNGECEAVRNPGDACSVDVHCSTSMCKGGQCCAAGTKTECAACGGAGGGCSGCAPGQHLTATGGCENDKADGIACASNTECSHRVCRAHCCASGASEHCSSCNEAGACVTCAAGHYLAHDSTCAAVLPGGAACTADASCGSSVCKAHCCAAGVPESCSLCSDAGSCAACSAGWHMTASRACALNKVPGAACAGDIECAGGTCLSGRCCGKAREYCSGCDEGGACAACTTGRVLHGGECHAMLSDGAACAFTAVCPAGPCLGGRCCGPATDPQCAECNAGGGRCAACLAGFVLVEGGCVDAAAHAEAVRASAAAAAAARAAAIAVAFSNLFALLALASLFALHCIYLWLLGLLPRTMFNFISSLSAPQLTTAKLLAGLLSALVLYVLHHRLEVWVGAAVCALVGFMLSRL